MPQRYDELLALAVEARRHLSRRKVRCSCGAIQSTQSTNPQDDREYISVDEAARITSLGRTKIYELMARGRLEYIKIDKRRLIRRTSISALGDR